MTNIKTKKLKPGEALDIIFDLQRDYAELLRLVGEYREAVTFQSHGEAYRALFVYYDSKQPTDP